MMFDDDNTLELLTPTPDLVEVFGVLKAHENRLAGLNTTVREEPWAGYAWHPIAREMAAFSLMSKGFATESPIPDYEILHILSTELGIMSPQDFKEQFLHITEGNPVSRLYRKLTDVPSVKRLFKDENTLGWSGFQASSTDREAERAYTRRRMMVDYFRDSADWTSVRALELSNALSLLVLALDAGMLSQAETLNYARRVVTEASVRFASWSAFAQSLLRAHVFMQVHDERDELLVILERDMRFLEAALTGRFARYPWPRFTDGAPTVAVPFRG